MNAQNPAARIDATPHAVAIALIAAQRRAVERITAQVIAQSVLRREVETVRALIISIANKLLVLINDEQACTQVLLRLGRADFAGMPEFDGLAPEPAAARRALLQARLGLHSLALQEHRARLERGLAHARSGMIRRFAVFAVAGVAADPAVPVDSASVFMLACQVAAHLKDQLETAGFRWAGETTLISLYLNAIGCERRRSRERFVADPAASIVATMLGFRSALELHRAIDGLHQVTIGAANSARLETMCFDRRPCEAFEHAYRLPRTPQQIWQQLLWRAQRRPAHCAAPPPLPPAWRQRRS